MYSITLPKSQLKTVRDLLLKEMSPGTWFFLKGIPGAGKTTLCQEVISSFGIKKREIQSPTFAILNTYTLPDGSITKIIHLDLYRLKSAEEIFFLGLENEISGVSYVAFVEWPERLTKEEWTSFFRQNQISIPHCIEVTIDALDQRRTYTIRPL